MEQPADSTPIPTGAASHSIAAHGEWCSARGDRRRDGSDAWRFRLMSGSAARAVVAACCVVPLFVSPPAMAQAGRVDQVVCAEIAPYCFVENEAVEKVCS